MSHKNRWKNKNRRLHRQLRHAETTQDTLLRRLQMENHAAEWFERLYGRPVNIVELEAAASALVENAWIVDGLHKKLTAHAEARAYARASHGQ